MATVCVRVRVTSRFPHLLHEEKAQLVGTWRADTSIPVAVLLGAERSERPGAAVAALAGFVTSLALSICDSGDHVRATLVLGHAGRILLEARRNEQLGLASIARAVMEHGAAWGGAE